MSEGYPGPGPEERKWRNRRYFRRHGVWPQSVLMERIARAGGEMDPEFAEDMSKLAGLFAKDIKRELRR